MNINTRLVSNKPPLTGLMNAIPVKAVEDIVAAGEPVPVVPLIVVVLEVI